MSSIFCLWEAKAKPPAYLVLAMSSWLDYLSFSDLHVINHSNIAHYLAPFYDVHALSKFGFSKQGDALEAALLMERGGVCLDLDTILVNDGCKDFIHQELTGDVFRIYGDSERGSMHCAVVASSKGGTAVTRWTEECARRIVERSEPVEWNYLANAVIEPIYHSLKGTNTFVIEELAESQAVVETWHGAELGERSDARYKNFWFGGPEVHDVHQATEQTLSIPGGLVLLHNSWTPEEYFKKTADEVLVSDCVMGHVLKRVSHPEAYEELESLLILGSDV